MFYDNYGNRPPISNTQNAGRSITIPNQAPSLKYIVQALARGETLNLKQAYKFDKEPSLDEGTLPNDLQSLSSSDLEALLKTFSETPNPSPDLSPEEPPTGPSI